MTVTLSQIKKSLKIEYDYDDNELLRLRDAVVDLIGKYTGMTMYVSKKTQYLPYFMRTRLTGVPFHEINSVKYTNTSGTVVTMLTTDYFIDRTCEPSIYINFLEYPSIKEGTFVEVEYKCGMILFDKSVEQLTISMIGAWYNNPEAVQPIGLSTVPLSAQFIMDQWKVQGDLE
jgi:hypothetical protein